MQVLKKKEIKGTIKLISIAVGKSMNKKKELR
jgi:hypothetical protein